MSPHDVRCLAKPLVVLMASFLMPVVGMAQQEKAPARADGPDGRAGVGGADQRGLQATAAEIERVAASGAVVARSPRTPTQEGQKGAQKKLPYVVFDKKEGRITQIVVTTPEKMVNEETAKLGLTSETAARVAEASKYAVRISNLRDSQGKDVWKALIASGVVIKAKNDDRGCYAMVARHSVNEIRDIYENKKDPTDWAYRRDRVHTKHVVEMDYTRWPKGYLVDVEVKNKSGGYEKIPGTVIGCDGQGNSFDQYPSFDHCVVRLSKPAGFGGVALSPSSATGGLVSLGFSQYNKPENKPGDSQPILLADPGCSEMESIEKKEDSYSGIDTNCHGYDGFSGGPVIGFSKNGEPQLAGIIVRGGDGTASSRTQEGRKPSYTQGTFVRATSIYEDDGRLREGGMNEFVEWSIKNDLRGGNKDKCR